MGGNYWILREDCASSYLGLYQDSPTILQNCVTEGRATCSTWVINMYGSALVAVTLHTDVSDRLIMSSGAVTSGLLHIVMYTFTTTFFEFSFIDRKALRLYFQNYACK